MQLGSKLWVFTYRRISGKILESQVTCFMSMCVWWVVVDCASHHCDSYKCLHRFLNIKRNRECVGEYYKV
jgi:hypothetical protein